MRWTFANHLKSFVAAIIAVGMVGALAACQPRQVEDPWTADAIDLNIRASQERVLAGEVVTFTAMTRDTLGRDVNVEWDASGGELTVEQNGRIARVHYDRPGNYIVTARLFVDGEIRRTDSAEVTVRPVNDIGRDRDRNQQQYD